MILFDLDGTLVDSVPDLTYCVDAMLRELGLPGASEDDVRRWVGNGAERLVKRALTRTMDDDPLDITLYRRAYDRLLDLYAENTDKFSRLYPGVRDGLDYVRTLGCPVGCVTNKAERFTLPLLKSLGIYADFRIIIGGDTLPARKPDPFPLLYCAGQCNADPGHSVMVGDSINDLHAARAAGMRILCVSYGYNHGNDIGVEGPDAVMNSLAELPAYL
ncbi:MAG: phosphoglycolate phosphatase [Chromatiales bacterium]